MYFWILFAWSKREIAKSTKKFRHLQSGARESCLQITKNRTLLLAPGIIRDSLNKIQNFCVNAHYPSRSVMVEGTTSTYITVFPNVLLPRLSKYCLWLKCLQTGSVFSVITGSTFSSTGTPTSAQKWRLWLPDFRTPEESLLWRECSNPAFKLWNRWYLISTFKSMWKKHWKNMF